MNENLLIIIVVLQIILFVALTLIWRRLSLSPGDNKEIEKLERSLREEMALNRKEISDSSKSSRGEMQLSIKQFGDSLDKRIQQMSSAVEVRLRHIQNDNTVALEKMRATVDEKLQSTLEKRLGESFKQVGDRLEQVHKGLGEMQSLAVGVGDLKRVLANVKTRGTWGEIQLGSLLEQILTPGQYETNVAVKDGSNDRVEFAIKIPTNDNPIYLPIDAKFPLESYSSLVSASEEGKADIIQAVGKDLENRIKLEAKKIKEKYIDPPRTTDFAILYLPIEGLYAEITQRVELTEQIQRTYRVVVAGPSTISALLNSLQMGFRTFAIQKRTSEVWELLNEVKTEFGRFGDILDKTRKKLQEASHSIDSASTKSRTIERKLNKMQTLAEPEGEQSETKILPDKWWVATQGDSLTLWPGALYLYHGIIFIRYSFGLRQARDG